METVKVDPNNLVAPWLIEKVSAYLRRGEVLACPTDTVYGLGCRADRDESVDRIYTIKRREKHKPLLVLVSSLAMAEQFFEVDDKQKKVLQEYWPGKESTQSPSYFPGDGRY